MRELLQYLSEVFFIIGRDKSKLPYAVALFFLLSILDVVAIGLLAPYLSIVSGSEVDSLEVFDYIRFFSNIPNSRESLLIYLGGALLVLFFFKTILVFYVNKEILNFSNSVMIRLRTSLMWTYQNMPYLEYIEKNTSEHLHSIQNLTSSLSATLITLLRSVSDIIIATVIVSYLFVSDATLLVLLIFFLGGGIFIYDSLFKRKLFMYGKLSNQAGESMIRGITEGMTGYKDIKILGKERYFYNVVKGGVVLVAESNMKQSLIQTMPRYIFEFFLLCFIILFVIFIILTKGNVNVIVPTIILFGVASIRLTPIFTGLSTSLGAIRYSRYAISSLYEDLLLVQSVEKKSDTKKDVDIALFNSLIFNNVGFTYPNTDKSSLSNISISIFKNETIGIIGESGSGKTTLVNMMLGFLTPQKGVLLYNNEPLKDSLSAWRKQIAYLPQDIFLVDDTLESNIALGIESKNIDSDRVVGAINQAQLSNFLETLPNGIKTNIGEAGLRLSGGQRQRVALARSFYFGRDILIMDEATSALDNETEREIIKETLLLKGKRTIIIIAHRMSTIKHCDRIYHMKEGRVINSGSYDEVVKTTL